ncbi:TetR/AcrR family transcriptional regulator C-terminal domain-containing protein [Pendulispora brunnea]|uniref:TetR/AcrR family transcriptional regulator C-terminal domain-containing protein n=1 Tax=Pendulispora brunnea TaxID=2905690 RepID=A0ABZ2JVG6_9BACT
MKARSKHTPLSRERILSTALSILDREGLEAISMRRVGDELGVEAMSLYNHVANKAAMLDGIFETILRELPAPARSSSWRSALRKRARELRQVLRAHPHALPIFATRPAVTPASLAHVESVLEVLRRAGFSPRRALGALQVLAAYVVGHTIATRSPRKPDEDARPAYERLSEEHFPRVREAARVLANYDETKEFELGLEAMLTGLEAARRGHSSDMEG